MKTIAQKISNILLICLPLAPSDTWAQSANIILSDSIKKTASFEVGLFIEAQGKLNLMLAIHRPRRVSVTLRNASRTVLYGINLRKAAVSYRQKFNFEGSPPGVYQLEISDGQQTLVRRVEVVDIPAIEPQRYITYGLRTPVELP